MRGFHLVVFFCLSACLPALKAIDSDGDGFSFNIDCDDKNPAINPDAIEICNNLDDNCNNGIDEGVKSVFYADADFDGYGDVSTFLIACRVQDGYVENPDDCDDSDYSIHPEAEEFCGNGIDEDCTGKDFSCSDADEDEDGFSTNRGDCNDSDSSINPDAEEICDGIDNDCDEEVDEDSAADANTWYRDVDEDGFGVAAFTMVACNAPVGYANTAGDCNDFDSAYNPNADEFDCTDPHDYNCDGSVGYADVDGDGYAACEECDDLNLNIHPGVAEICDNLDNNCDSIIDDDAVDQTIWYHDADNDDYGDTSDSVVACEAPFGYIATAGDCDDAGSSNYPEAIEYCDGVDNNCDGVIDEDSAADAVIWYHDADNDDYGDTSDSIVACDAPFGYIATAGDCDDTNVAINRGALEICDFIDNDCDTSTDEGFDYATFYHDEDGDGFGISTSSVLGCSCPEGYSPYNLDCDDANTVVYPGAVEYCDDLDNDCDSSTDESCTCI